MLKQSHPGKSKSEARATARISDLYLCPEKAELVSGNLVRMPPTGGKPSDAAFEIAVSLRRHAHQTGIGKAISNNAGFLVKLPNRQSFSPDAAYWTGEEPTMRFYEGAPVFAVEVRSEGDYGPAAERLIIEKRNDYFSAGTLVVWDVDLLSDDIISVYQADNIEVAIVFRRGDIANAEPAVPGWSFKVSELLLD